MAGSHQFPARRSGLFVPMEEADSAQGEHRSPVHRFAAIPGSEAGCHLRSDHSLLLTAEAASPRPARIDAIIVPTVRAPSYLMDAAAVAVSLDCPLVTLHSGRQTQSASAARLLSKAVDLIAIDVSDPRNLRLPETETSRMLGGTIFARRTDTSHKRNLGLVLSHMMRWERIVFLDDDIHVPNPDHLRQAVGLLDTYNAVGYLSGDFLTTRLSVMPTARSAAPTKRSSAAVRLQWIYHDVVPFFRTSITRTGSICSTKRRECSLSQ